jgi:sialidase-1
MHSSSGTITRPVGLQASSAMRVFRGLLAVALFSSGVIGSTPILLVSTAAAETSSGLVSKTAVSSTVAAASVRTTPFRSSSKKKTWYRIPAIVKNADGVLLAFAERRDNNNSSDMGNFDVVLRRSKDGGRTWLPIQTIADDGKNRVSNPVPMLDPTTGDVLLITSIRITANDTYKGIFLQRSTDGGVTFTKLSDSQLPRPQGSWKGGLTGPGHGVVLTQGEHAGRIVVALGYKSNGYYGAYGIYSDDGGRSWRTGYDQNDPSGRIAYMEGTLTETASGRLFIAYRNGKASNKFSAMRYCAYSTDGGETLASPFVTVSALKTPSVEGSALAVTGSYAGLLLFSAPSYTDSKRPTVRRDMSIFASGDEGATWRAPYVLDLRSYPAAYSDLVQVDDQTIGLLYETGNTGWRERIDFRSVAVSELIDPVKATASVRAAATARTVKRTAHAKVRVAVAVKGTPSPVGGIAVTFTRSGTASGTVTAMLTYPNKGTRSLTLPKLHAGTYRISVAYRGTSRIAGKTVSGGKLTVR